MEITSGDSENGYAPVILWPQDEIILSGKIFIGMLK
jgi:hypothetical protein